jgi:hypothetical protein
MQVAVQLTNAHVGTDILEKIFMVAPNLAKVLKDKNPAQIVRELGDAFRTTNQRMLQSYLVTLKTSNQFQIQEKLNNAVTKSLGSAALNMNTFRRVAMEMLMAVSDNLNTGLEDSLEIFQRLSAQTQSLKDQFGVFIARAVNPLAKSLSNLVHVGFTKLYLFMESSKKVDKEKQQGIIDLTKHFLIFGASIVGLATSVSILSFILAPFGLTLGGIISLFGFGALAMKAFKGETRSWTKALAALGTELEFYWNVLSSFNGQSATIKGNVWSRFLGLDKDTQDRILSMSKALGLFKEFLLGIADGFRNIGNAAAWALGWVGKILSYVPDRKSVV